MLFFGCDVIIRLFFFFIGDDDFIFSLWHYPLVVALS